MQMQTQVPQVPQVPQVKPNEKLQPWLARAVPVLVDRFGKAQDQATQLATQAWMQVNGGQMESDPTGGWAEDSADDAGGFGKAMWDDEEDSGFDWGDEQDDWGQPVAEIADGKKMDNVSAGSDPSAWYGERLLEHAHMLSTMLEMEEEISPAQRTMIDAAAEMLINLLGEQVGKLKDKPVEDDAPAKPQKPKTDKPAQDAPADAGAEDATEDAPVDDAAPEGDAPADDNPFADDAGGDPQKKKKRNPFASSKATTLIALFESEIHLHFTNLADNLRRDGHLTRAERIALSNCIGDALGSFVKCAEETIGRDVLYRSPFAEVGEDTPMGINPDATATKGGDGSGNFGHAGRPGERGGSAPQGGSVPKREVGWKHPHQKNLARQSIPMVEVGDKIKGPDGEWHTISMVVDNGEEVYVEGQELAIRLRRDTEVQAGKAANTWLDDEEDAAEGETPDPEPDAAADGEEDATDPEVEDDAAEDAAEGEPDDSAMDDEAGGEEDGQEGEDDDAEDKPAAKSLGGPVQAINAVKSLGKNRIGGYLMLWGDKNKRDLEGEYFRPETEEITSIFEAVKALPVIWHHAQDSTMKATVIGLIDTMKPDAIGMWVEAQIKNGKAYRNYVQPLLAQGMLGWSSGALPGSRKAVDGLITRWATVEGSLTPSPMDYRQVEHPIEEVKSFFIDAGLDWGQVVVSE